MQLSRRFLLPGQLNEQNKRKKRRRAEKNYEYFVSNSGKAQYIDAIRASYSDVRHEILFGSYSGFVIDPRE